MLAKASAAAAAAPKELRAANDGVPLQLPMRDARNELIATLTADVEGVAALRTLATDAAAAGGARTTESARALLSRTAPNASLRRALYPDSKRGGS